MADATKLVAKTFSVAVDFVDWPEQESLLESGDTIFDGSKLEEITDYSYRYKLMDWLISLGA